MDLWKLLADIVVLLAACLIGGGIASRFKQSPLVGYLLGGMLIGGPGSLGFVNAQKEIEAIAELGVALLLFSLGLEFSLPRLKTLGAKPIIGGVLQVILTMAVGTMAALCFSMGFRSSLAFGAMIALSSTAVVLRILMERGEIEMPHGRNSLGVLLTQDIAVVPLALLMTLLGGGESVSAVGQQVGILFAVAIGLSLAIYGLTKIAVIALGTLTIRRNRELTVIFAAGMGLGAAWAAHWAGISPALGAFIAGMLLGSSEFSTQIRADVSTLRVLLLTLFFGSAGMVADPIWIFWHAHWVAGAAVLIILGKVALIAIIFVALGQTLRVALATGLALAQLGEFAFVLGAIGRTSGVVTTDEYALVVSVTIVAFIFSALMIPRANEISDRLVRWFGQNQPGQEQEASTSCKTDVLVIGYGPTAQWATMPFIGSKARVTVIDLNPEGVKLARDQGFTGQLGDATLPDVLEHASVGEAELAMITIPHYESALKIVELIHSLNESIRIYTRCRFQAHAATFETAGAFVFPDEEQVGKRIADQVTQWLDANGSLRPAKQKPNTILPHPLEVSD